MTVATAPALWRHQEEALAIIRDKDAALLDMGMGTGKSLIAITEAKRMAKRVLILCPLSVVPAWREQFDRFAPEWRGVYLYKGSVAKKARAAKKETAMAAAMGSPLVVVINYESARNNPFASWALLQKFDLLVMDESHRLKSPKGATSRWVFQLSRTVHKRLALTGTPMPHSPLDIWAQMRSLDPRVFGTSFYSFRNKYSVFGGWKNKERTGNRNMGDLRERLSHRTFPASRDVLDLPPAIHERRLLDLGTKGQRIYDDLDRDFCAWVREGQEVTAQNSLVKLLRLMQLTSGLVSVETGYDEAVEAVRVDRTKEDAIVDLLEDLPEDEPVVVFGRFKGDLESVHAAAKRLKRGSLELSGSRRELAEWQAGAAPILAAQIQAGGVGIDLVRARYCLFASVGFSLGDYLQALARCHRPGQDRTVFYYHLIARGTVDEKVYRALKARKNVVEAVLADIQNRKKDGEI